MSTFRPAINPDDGYFKKIVKYIPAEIIAAYTFCIGLIISGSSTVSEKCDGNFKFFPLIFFGLLLFTPIYMYLSVIDNPTIDPGLKKKQALFHSIVSVVAFITWVYALGDNPMICFLKNIFHHTYNSILGSLVMVGFCLSVPVLERIIIGKPSSVKIKN